jgi:hypothetical protein
LSGIRDSEGCELKCGYQTLVLFALHSQDDRRMSKKGERSTEAHNKEPDAIAWYKLASLASQVGFDSAAIALLITFFLLPPLFLGC